jgi:methylenetetrahydrofolate reductase (NADPH)
MDAEILARYMRRLAEHGIPEKMHFLVGIAALKSARSARWMRERLYGTIISEEIVGRMDRAADPAAEGRKIALELIAQYAEIPGVAGVHIMGPSNGETIPAIIAQARAARLA